MIFIHYDIFTLKFVVDRSTCMNNFFMYVLSCGKECDINLIFFILPKKIHSNRSKDLTGQLIDPIHLRKNL